MADSQDVNDKPSMSDDEYRQALRHFAGVDDELLNNQVEPDEQPMDSNSEEGL